MSIQAHVSDPSDLARGILASHPVLADKIAVATGTSDTDIVALFSETLKYLVTCGRNPAHRLTPSLPVDAAWHEFILCTKPYHEFCETVIGRFVHHTPGTPSSETDYANTLSLIEREFGPVSTDFWPKHQVADCGCDGNPSCINA